MTQKGQLTVTVPSERFSTRLFFYSDAAGYEI